MRPHRNGFAVIFLIGSLMLCAWTVLPHTAFSRECDTPLTTLHDLLLAAYPDLLGKERFMHISINDRVDSSWSTFQMIQFEVTPLSPDTISAYNPATLDPHTGKRVPPPENPSILSGEVWFDKRGYVSKMWAGGPDITHDRQNSDIEDLIESHPEWSNARDYAELKKAGALYGPKDKDEFLRSVHLERFEKTLGHLKIKSAEFNGLIEVHEGAFAGMFWGIEVQAQLPDGSTSTYGFIFEPFAGRLTQIQDKN